MRVEYRFRTRFAQSVRHEPVPAAAISWTCANSERFHVNSDPIPPTQSVDSSGIVIRQAVLDDADDVLEFLEQFVEARRILPRALDEVEQLVPTGFVAECNGKLVGFAALEVYSKKLAEVRSLCVLPEMQGQGIGKRLARACVQLAEQRKVFEVMVITSSDDFFRNCGFDFTLPGEKKALFLQTRETP